MCQEKKYYCLSLFYNLLTDIDEINFTNNLRLVRTGLLNNLYAETMLGKEIIEMSKPIDSETVNIVLNQTHFKSFEYSHNHLEKIFITPSLSNHVLEYHSIGQDIVRSNNGITQPVKLFYDILTSLRLLKFGYVELLNAVQRFDPGKGEKVMQWSDGSNNNIQHYILHKPYNLVKEDVENLKKLFNAISKCENQKIHVALNRLNRVYQKTWDLDYDVDKLIDLMIAFEALYVQENLELSFRLALRASRHLGKSPDERDRIFNCLKTAYNIRSGIVHGTMNSLKHDKKVKRDMSKYGWKTSFYMIKELEEFLRRSLCSVLLDNNSANYIENIDMSIARGE